MNRFMRKQTLFTQRKVQKSRKKISQIKGNDHQVEIRTKQPKQWRTLTNKGTGTSSMIYQSSDYFLHLVK